MAKTIIGVDIGACELKLAVCSGGEVQRLVAADMPENLERDGRIISPAAMADFLKEVAKKEKVAARGCAVILPSSIAYTRSMAMPAMTIDKLKLNLPYEFRDFITQEKDKYYYDYIVQSRTDGEDGQPKEFEIMAAVTLKEVIAQYNMMFRRAGFKLLAAMPEEFAYMNLVRDYDKRSKGALKDKEFAFLDLGHTASRLHIYNGSKHITSRIIEVGARMIDDAIAEQNGIDEHIARTYKQANKDNALYSEACMSVYNTIVVDVMRAISFHRFNSQDSNLSDVFVCGGGAKIAPLIEILKNELDVTIHDISEILPKSSNKDQNAALCPMAIGVTMQ